MDQTEGQKDSDPTPRRISFGRFVLDLANGRLLSSGREIPLRPQALAVLSYLAERPGQAVPAEQIIDAVWPGLIGSDDLLLQSIGELRRVLGDADCKLITYDLEHGATLHTAAAAPERRQARGVQPLRFRWMYGLVAPLVMVAVFTVIWLVTSREPSAPVAETLPAVAVLPFQNQSDDAELARRADSLTQDIIAELSRQSVLTVKSWDDVAVYKGVLAQPGEVARVLAVTYQVEGSVRYADSQVRVSVQLVDLQGRVLWSARYVEPAAEAPTLHQRIAAEIANALAAALARG